MTRYLVTGAAGFIGFHVCRYLLDRGETVVGLDNVNDYYDVRLKEDRLRAVARPAGVPLRPRRPGRPARRWRSCSPPRRSRS